MNLQFFLTFLLMLFLSFSVFAGEREEIDQAIKKYGDEARTLMNEAEDALKKGIPEVEDYFNNPSEVKKPQESFFGFSERRVSVPFMDASPSCGNCRHQSLEFMSNSSDRKKPQKASVLTPCASFDVIVFVSLGMSEASLKALAKEAESLGARIVIRGLLENSFKATMARLQELQIALEIDPPLFEQFRVERVPTFVRCKLHQGEPVIKGHDRVSGNIPLHTALELFKEKGTCS